MVPGDDSQMLTDKTRIHSYKAVGRITLYALLNTLLKFGLTEPNDYSYFHVGQAIDRMTDEPVL